MKRSRIERSLLSNVENGLHSMASVRLYDLAEGLRVDVSDLFEADLDVPTRAHTAPLAQYLQLVDFISKEMVTGLLRSGDVLGSEATLYDHYGYSRFAIRNALAILRGRGLTRT